MSRTAQIEIFNINEQLPEPAAGPVCVYGSDEAWYMAAYNHKRGDWGDEDAQPITDDEITHWFQPPPVPGS